MYCTWKLQKIKNHNFATEKNAYCKQSYTGCPTNIVTTLTLIFSYLAFHKCKSKTCSGKAYAKNLQGATLILISFLN